MVVLIHLLVLGWCALECLAALKNPRARFLKLIMFSALGLIHGLVPALTPRSLAWPGASGSSLLLAAVLALTGVVAFSLGWRAAEAGRPQWDGLSPGLLSYFQGPQGRRVLKRMFWLCGALAVAGWLGTMIVSAGSITAAFEAGRFEYRMRGSVYLRVVLQHVVNLIAIPGFACFFLPRSYRLLGVAFTLVMAGLLFLGSQGARAVSMGLIGTLVIGYTLRHHLAPHRLLLIGAGGALVVMLSIALYEVRKVMAQRTLGEMAAMIVSPATYQDALARDPLNYHQILVAAVEHFPRDHPYLNGATYLRLLVFYLPRDYFPQIKPEDTHNTFARVITHYTTRATIPPTMMGDAYINFWGVPGVPIVMLANGLLFGFASRKIRESPLCFFALGAPFARLALLMVRGSPYEVLVLVLSALGLVLVLAALCGHSWRGAGAPIRQVNRLARQGLLAPGRRPAVGGVAPATPAPGRANP